jgi:Predicted glycosyltransferases
LKPIGFIIITYNRRNDLLELLKNISGLDGATELLEEVIVVNNASTEDYSQVKNYIGEQDRIPFRYYDAPENLGVARGRNYALQKSSAPVLIMLDDDAVLQNNNCLYNLLGEFEATDTEREKAVISFKVLYYGSLQMQKNALPHKHFEEYKDKSFFETYYYAGGAHAIRRKILDEIGRYPENFFYGMEEYDLSYRILNAGYSIVYSDNIVMLHKESPLGRKPKEEKLRMMWVNKVMVAYKYLPKRYMYSTAIMWSLFYLKQTGFNVSGFFKGWKEIAQIHKREKRFPIHSTTLSYLKKVKARLWY